MKKVIKIIAISIVLMSCGQGNNEATSANEEKNAGVFSGSLAGKTYNVGVNCAYFDQGYFQFLSDKTDVSDTNGDGIIIAGMENNGKFVLTITDKGETYSVGRLANFTKHDNKAEGGGKLYKEGTADTYDVQFSVTCG